VTQIEVKIRNTQIRTKAENFVRNIEYFPKREFDRFTIGPVLHETENSRVNIVFDNKENEFLILKELPPQMWYLASNEWRILKKIAQIRRGKIRSPQAIYRTQTGFYMSLVDGEILERGASVQETIDKIIDLADQIRSLHRAKIVHRDIKPANIRINGTKAALIDFGISLDEEEEDPIKRGLIGTVEYMAPERFIEQRNLEYPADMYALGVIMYELIEGRLPFDNPFWNVNDYSNAHKTQVPAKPNAQNSRLRALSNIIMKCLEKNPKNRFNSEDLPLAIEEELKKIK
jgi:serine/threonine protein kinase